MNLSSNFRMLARYNQRMNQQLLTVCGQLSSDQLQQQTHSFFPNIMSYWNHILFGDLIMLQRLIANDLVSLDKSSLEDFPVAKSVDDTFVSTINELRKLVLRRFVWVWVKIGTS